MNDNQLEATVPAIDFSSLPIVETAADLRLLGQQLLATLLESGERPSLAPLLTPSLVDLLLPGAGITAPPIISSGAARRPSRWRLRWSSWWQRRAIVVWLKKRWFTSRLAPRVSRLPFVRRQPPESRYNDLVDRAARQQISSFIWRQTVNERLRLALYGHPPKSIPPTFWPIIGEIAWGDLEAQRHASQAVYSYLRPYYLFCPEFGAAARLSPKSFWTLIALAAPFPGGLALTANRRGRYVAAHHLQQIAREQLLVEGWAGFWDQWLLWQVWRHWPAAFDPETEIYGALTALPLFTQLSETPIPPPAPGQENLIPPRLTAPNWNEGIPSWFLQQYQEWQLE